MRTMLLEMRADGVSQTRAGAVGARFQVVSGAGRGTVVTVEWPLGKGEGDDV